MTELNLAAAEAEQTVRYYIALTIYLAGATDGRH